MKRLIILVLCLLCSCYKMETFQEENIKWTIVYCLEDNRNTYTFEFFGKESAYYEITQIKDFNVLLVYPEVNTTMVKHVFKSEKQIIVLEFYKIGA